MTDRSELRKLASEATAGEWEVWTSNSVRRITASGKQDGGVLSAVTTRDGMPDLHGNNRERDLTYIAAANPQTVIALLDQLDRAEAECGELRKEHDSLVEATVLGPLKGKTAHDEIIGLRAQLSACRAALTEACDGWERCGDSAMHFGARIKALRSVGQPK